MAISVSRAFGLAALGAAILGSAPANAVIYNIAAGDDVGTEVSFDGTTAYLIKWVGIADGGAYDAASVQFCVSQGNCTTGFSNAFVARNEDFGSTEYEVQVFSTAGAGYGTAAESLAAYKSGDNIRHTSVDFLNGDPVNITFEGFLPKPWIVTPDAGTVHLVVLDTDGTRDNNLGGVSLSIERFAPVPEPAAWAMMIAGFGLAGAALRRRSVTFATA